MNKTNILIIVLLASIVMACNTETKKENQALKAKIEALQAENQQLSEGNFTMAMSIENYHETLKQVDAQLAAIDQIKELVKTKTTEFKNDAQLQAEIEMHIKHLHEANTNAKQKLSHMNKSLNMLRKDNVDSHQRIHELEMETHNMARSIVARDQEISDLHRLVVAEGITIVALDEAYSRQIEYSAVLLDIINTGFYAAGTAQELETMGIIEKQGGFIGIGRVKMLQADAPVEFINPIDIREYNSFEFEAKNLALITPHAEGSFEIETNENITSISITDKLKFWQESNYLVIELIK